MTTQQIQEHWNPASNKCGKLIKNTNGTVWHYSVALSDEWAMSWGANGGGLMNIGHLYLQPITSDFTACDDVDYLDMNKIFKNLNASVKTFHNDWWYNIQGWNCEHWARLVVSGKAVSTQVAHVGNWASFVIGRIFVDPLFNFLARHNYAEELLAKAVNE